MPPYLLANLMGLKFEDKAGVVVNEDQAEVGRVSRLLQIEKSMPRIPMSSEV